MKGTKKQQIIYILLLILIIAVSIERGVFNTGGAGGSAELSRVYENQISNIQVMGDGIVEKVLKDDTQGSKHQRMIVRVGPDQTILIAHNIDLAPRVANVKEGDPIEFYGEYEWNNKGGVVHWTHKDPRGKHTDGWIMHAGARYE